MREAWRNDSVRGREGLDARSGGQGRIWVRTRANVECLRNKSIRAFD